MSAPRLCLECRHPVGLHSHMNWHECKVDGCDCPAYARKALANSSKGDES